MAINYGQYTLVSGLQVDNYVVGYNPNDTSTLRRFDISQGVTDANQNFIFQWNSTSASAVNYLQVKNSATTLTPAVEAVGSDANIGITFTTKGSGNVTSTGDFFAPNATINQNLVVGDGVVKGNFNFVTLEGNSSTVFEQIGRFTGPDGVYCSFYRNDSGGNNYIGIDSFAQGAASTKTIIALQEFGGGVTIGTNILTSGYSFEVSGNVRVAGNIDATGTVLGSNLSGTNTGDQTTSGTTNRISVTNGTTNPVVDIASTYAGQTSINTLGTITSGAWNGSVIPVVYGGTGQSTYADGEVLIGNSTGSTLSKSTLTAGSNISITNGSGSITISTTGAPAHDDLTVNRNLTVGNGVEKGDINIVTLQSNASTAFEEISRITGPGGQYFSTYRDASGGNNYVGMEAFAQGAVGTKTFIAFQEFGGGVAIGKNSLTSGYVLDTGSNVRVGGNMDATGTVLGSNLSGTNTGDQTTSGTANRISVTNGSTSPVVDIASTYVGQTSITTLGTVGTGTWDATTIAVNKGGTGQTSYTNGQLLIGNTTGNTLALGTLGSTNGISVTNGAGSIDINANINTTNLQFTSNQINTIQDIGTASSPTFGGGVFEGNVEIGQPGTSSGVLFVTGAQGNTSTVFETLMVLRGADGSFCNLYRDGFGGNNYVGMESFAQGAAGTKTPFVFQEFGGNFGVGGIPASRLGVFGNVSIGSGYAGASAAPTNGALIEGDVGIKTTAITSGYNVDINGALNVRTNALIGAGQQKRSDNGLTLSIDSNTTFPTNSNITDAERTLSIVNENDTNNTYAALSMRAGVGASRDRTFDLKMVNGATGFVYGTFGNNNTSTYNDAFYLDQDGNMGVGSIFRPTFNSGGVLFFGGRPSTATDPTMSTDTAGLFAKDVSGTTEMFAIDEAGNVTQISPHDEEGNWQFYSKNVKTGRTVKIAMEKLVKFLDDYHGTNFYEEISE